MPKFTIHQQKLFDSLMADAEVRITDTFLSTLADQECRLCLLELGIN